MAIEFDCPRCSATIRVPDAYSGRQGRCPQCNERLLVPLIAVPSAPPAAPMAPMAAAWPESSPLASPSATPQQYMTAPAPISSPVPAPAAAPGVLPAAGETASQPAPAAAIPAATIAMPTALTSGMPLAGGPLSKSARTGRGKSSRYSRRRPNRALILGIPVAGFLMLMAILALTIDFSGGALSGQLNGRVLAEKSLPRTVVAWSEVSVSAEDQQVLQDALTETPETFSSELLICRLLGTPAGLEIQLTAASGSKWCAVNPHDANQKALALWLKQQRERLGTSRRSEMVETLSAWCRDKLQQIQGQQISIDAGIARDQGVLNATVNSLGYALQGRVGKRLIRAAAEDDTGWLYFCVPGDATEMVVEGRILPGDLSTFPGHYDVVIGNTPAAKNASGSKSKAGEDASKASSEENTMQPEGDMQDAEKADMKMQDDAAEMMSDKAEQTMNQ